VPAAGRCLIVSADDLGLSPGVNAGIVLAHQRGLVASAGLMANAPFFEPAAELAVGNPGLDIGVHLNLVGGRPLSPPGEIQELVGGDGRLRPFRLRRCGPAFLAQAEREYRRQIERILAAGIRPSHIDFEKHHAWPAPLRRLACRLAGEYGIPAARNLREPLLWAWRRLGWPGWRRAGMAAALRAALALSGPVRTSLASPDHFLGQWRIGAMDEAAWLRLAAGLPAGISEAMTHPGLAEAAAGTGEGGHPRLAEAGKSWIGKGRETELAALLSPRVRRALAEAGVELINFAALSAARP
jgi:predicted glycoside hydrolase/deacetylase ChbG (UPF0249 family)